MIEAFVTISLIAIVAIAFGTICYNNGIDDAFDYIDNHFNDLFEFTILDEDGNEVEYEKLTIKKEDE